MIHNEIQSALDTELSQLTGLPDFQRENTITKPVAGKPFIRSTLLPSRPNQLTMGVTGRDQLIGLHQIDLYYQMGSGSLLAKAQADQIVDLFPRTWTAEVEGYQLRVTQSWQEAAREVNNWYVVTVMLSWSLIK